MAPPKGKKTKANGIQDGSAQENSADTLTSGDITSNAELKTFLQSLLDRMEEGQVAPIFAFSAINHLLSKSEFFPFFCTETKELARDIWLRVKQSGLQIRNPPFLFGTEAEVVS